ncbi:bifunctional ornithine acetyltransferase/N-acetylglutamate synthase [Candidatus Endobugula sertula]|uniref:Arginine biosynthesis bifunctional protein ArgJ n=1 Tax=Candidatus Endobugula sertula TaxID=62101 RepID=A0A1D2QNY9_9GAMM|nr:bifunctional ornithine acetyltransferase/N-acetylglutamate synthase [Candidatus Endobugula sertula]
MQQKFIPLPQGFEGICCNVGLKSDSDDCLMVKSNTPSISMAMYTQSLFAGPSVNISKAENQSEFQAIVVLSKNANVATGEAGTQHALHVRRLAANIMKVPENKVLIASTGIIGQQYPMAAIKENLASLPDQPLQHLNAYDAASAIMTTDTQPKYYKTNCGSARIVGIAKGVGMIEPNMATMLSFFFTDANLDKATLEKTFKNVVAKTFDATSIDTDTSTSDTAAIISNGLAGSVSLSDFEEALYTCSLELTKMITLDGEGATKSIIVNVSGARDDKQAKRVAKSVVNSPLVKTAVHGSDPNWGRIVMAIGKLEQEIDILPDKVTINFGELSVYPPSVENSHQDMRKQLTRYLQQDEVTINIDLSIAAGQFTAFGCDLSEGYIRINADYTT